LTQDGNYTLTGSNDYALQVEADEYVNLVLDNATIHANLTTGVVYTLNLKKGGTITLIGTNEIRCSGNGSMISNALVSNGDLEIASDTGTTGGKLTIEHVRSSMDNAGIALYGNLSITGDAGVAVRVGEWATGIQCISSDISVSSGASLGVGGSSPGYCYRGLQSNGTPRLDIGGTASFKADKAQSIGILTENGSLAITGSGTVVVEGTQHGIYANNIIINRANVTVRGGSIGIFLINTGVYETKIGGGGTVVIDGGEGMRINGSGTLILNGSGEVTVGNSTATRGIYLQGGGNIELGDRVTVNVSGSYPIAFAGQARVYFTGLEQTLNVALSPSVGFQVHLTMPYGYRWDCSGGGFMAGDSETTAQTVYLFPAGSGGGTIRLIGALTVGLTAGDGKVTLAPQTAETGFAFYYTKSAATATAPSYGVAIGPIGATLYTAATDISGTNGTRIYVQVYKVETGGTIVGYGELGATPTAVLVAVYHIRK
jgi:hypothetical protein